MDERTARSIASSLQEISRAAVQINNRLAEIGRLLKPEQEQSPDGD
jgi:hypothetical protein